MKYLYFSRQIFYSIFSLVIFSFLFSVFFVFSSSFAYTDPFILLAQEIEKLEKIGTESQWPDGLEGKCSTAYGAQIILDNKLSFTKINSQLTDIEYEKASVRFNNAAQKIDERLSKAVRDFPHSPASCSSSATKNARQQLQIIIEKRQSLFKQSITDEKFFEEYGRKAAEEDPYSKIFKETSQLMEKIKKDFRELKNAMKNLDSGSISSWKVNAYTRNKISQRAQAKGQAYVQGFAEELEGAFFDPLYKTRSKILTDLDALPSGESHSTKLFWPWGSVVNKKTEEKVDLKLRNYFESKDGEINLYQVQEVKKKTDITADLLQYKKQLENHLQIEESYQHFDPALSKEIKNSLVPFHKTLWETNILLQQQQKALHSVLNRQNIGVEN